MRKENIFVFSGGMDLDSERQYVGNGDSGENLNIITTSDGNIDTNAVTPVKGNTHKYTIPSITSIQNKQYRIYCPSATSYELDFLTTDGSVWFSVAAFTDPITGAAQIITDAASAGQSCTVTASGDYIFVEMTTNPAYEYTIISTGADNATFTIVKEAIDSDMIGELIPIGSYDLLGDLFVMSSVSNNVTTEIGGGILSTSNNGFGLIRVTTIAEHGLQNFSSVQILDTGTDADGQWIVIYVNSNAFDLLNSTYAVAATTGIVKRYFNSIGEIGVVTYNNHTDIHSYTRLLRSKELGFRISKQIDCVFQRVGDLVSGYIVDGYNNDKVFYFKGDYGTDYAINVVNSLGKYNYGQIADETRLNLRNLGVSFTFTEQNDFGGAVPSGNWRYAIRFLTQGFDATPFSDLTNVINVYEATEYTVATSVYGNAPDFVTTKVNNFAITGIVAGMFKYVELAGINYVENTFKSYIISRVTIPETATELNIKHNGFENDTTELDAGLLLDSSYVYESSRNISIIDKRLVRSNLKLPEVSEFAEFCLTFTHSVKRQTIQGCKRIDNDYQKGEYHLIENVNGYIGGMLNETYRFGCKFELINGTVTQDFYIDDIIFDCNATNSASLNPTRRIAGLPSFDLTDNSSDCSSVYSFYIEFSDINLNYVINGKRVKDFVKKIIFTRRELNPSILGSGIAIPTVEGDDMSGLKTYDTNATFYPYPMIGYEDFTTKFVGGGDSQYEDTLCVYIPDNLYNELSITRKVSDKLLNVGCGVVYNTVSGLESKFTELNGYTNLTSVTDVNVDDVADVDYGDIYAGVVKFALTIDGQMHVDDKSFVMLTQTDVQNVSANTDYGWRQIWYKRPFGTIEDQYGDRTTGFYETTGTELLIDNLTGTVTADVYPCDVFTQKTFYKMRYDFSSGLGGGLAYGFSFYSQNRINSQMRTFDDTALERNFPGPSTEDWLESKLRVNFLYNAGYTVRNSIVKTRVYDPQIEVPTELNTRMIWSPIKTIGLTTDMFRLNLPLDLYDLDPTFGEIVHHGDFNGELVTWQPRKLQRQYFNSRGTLTISDGSQVLLGQGSVLSRDGNTLTQYGSFHKWSIVKGRGSQGGDQYYWINTEMKKFMRLGYDGTVSLSDIKGLKNYLANNLRYVHGKTAPAQLEGILGVWNERHGEVIMSVNAYYAPQGTWMKNQYYNVGDIVYRAQPEFKINGCVYECTYADYSNSANEPGVGSSWRDFWKLKEYSDTSYYNRFTLVFNELRNKFLSFRSPVPRLYLMWRDTYFTHNPIKNFGKGYEHNVGDYCSWYDGELVEDGYITAILNDSPMEIKLFEAHRVNSLLPPISTEFSTNDKYSFLHRVEYDNREYHSDSSIKENEVETAISSITTIGNTVTITAPLHGLVVGDSVKVRGIEGMYGGNGIFEITSVTTNTFSYVGDISNVTGYVNGTGYWSVNNRDTGFLLGNYLETKINFKALEYQKFVSLATKFRYSPRYINR